MVVMFIILQVLIILTAISPLLAINKRLIITIPLFYFNVKIVCPYSTGSPWSICISSITPSSSLVISLRTFIDSIYPTTFLLFTLFSLLSYGFVIVFLFCCLLLFIFFLFIIYDLYV